jgi:protein SCO1
MRGRKRFSSNRTFVLLGFIACALIAAGCAREAQGDYPAANRADCLPNVTLTDQNGRSVSLASLKGKPVLVDFIYASCPSLCPMVTEKFAVAARRLGANLGSRVEFVSITVDPEHDDPAELRAFADKHDADRPGWLFLTGKPVEIEKVLDAYDLKRIEQSDGTVTHPMGSFLLGPDGHQLRQYDSNTVPPGAVVSDIERVLRHG